MFRQPQQRGEVQPRALPQGRAPSPGVHQEAALRDHGRGLEGLELQQALHDRRIDDRPAGADAAQAGSEAGGAAAKLRASSQVPRRRATASALGQAQAGLGAVGGASSTTMISAGCRLCDKMASSATGSSSARLQRGTMTLMAGAGRTASAAWREGAGGASVTGQVTLAANARPRRRCVRSRAGCHSRNSGILGNTSVCRQCKCQSGAAFAAYALDLRSN
jgi:hypothetical protein